MNKININQTISKTIDEVWQSWINPEDIKKWNYASDDWECPYAENDLRVGGKFVSRMSAKDNSSAFDFSGVYTEVVPHKLIAYTMDDGREAVVNFTETENGVEIQVSFDPEQINSLSMQKEGWQAILDNFKKYVEAK